MNPEYIGRLNAGPVQLNPDGTFSTHKMAWGTYNGKYIAFPTLVPDETGQLMMPRNPIAHAVATGNFMTFDNQEDAEKYASGGYKQGTGLQTGYRQLDPIDAYLQRTFRNRIPQ